MPLLFDMPFEDLLSYQGTNPKPADFDAFWDNAIQEIRQLDHQVELVPAEFNCGYAFCFHMYFTGVGGARIHAQLVKPKVNHRPGPALLKFHGYGSNAGDWIDKLPYAAAGYTVAAMDSRGQGGRSEDSGRVSGTTQSGHIIRGLGDNPANLLFRAIFLDTALLARIVMEMPEVDESRVGATGASQGGGLTLACAALEPRLKKAAPIYPFLSDYQRVWEMDQDVDAYHELREWFRRFDPHHQRQEQVFTQLGYIDIQHLAPRIKAEVMMATGLMDTVCPPSTQFAAYNKINGLKSLQLYPDFGHETLPEIADKIFQFMQS